MAVDNYNAIKRQEALIEEKRLAIKEEKKKISNLHNKLDMISNIYEYLAAPACAISLALVALTTGPIVYVLPTITALTAIGIITTKFGLKNRIEKYEERLAKLKEERKQAYTDREQAFENIFNNLNILNKDSKDYYHQLMQAHEKCNLMNEYMRPYKQKRKKLSKIKNVISVLFDYVLAPLGAIALPLFCSFADVGTVAEVSLLAASSATLLGCSLVDDRLTSKIDDLTNEIDDIKSDRTVAYVKRDIKLNEALEYLKSIDSRYNDISLQNQVVRERKSHVVSRAVKNR